MKSHRVMFDILIKQNESIPGSVIDKAFDDITPGVFVPLGSLITTYGRAGFKVKKTDRQTTPLAYQRHIETWIFLDMAKEYNHDGVHGVLLRKWVYL